MLLSALPLSALAGSPPLSALLDTGFEETVLDAAVAGLSPLLGRPLDVIVGHDVLERYVPAGIGTTDGRDVFGLFKIDTASLDASGLNSTSCATTR